MLDWTAFLGAVGLVFVFEGLLPFLSPSRSQKLFTAVSKMPLRELRLMGLSSMILGLIILFFSR